MTGMCEHNDIVETTSDTNGSNIADCDGNTVGGKKTKLGFFPPRPSNSSTSVAGTATAAAAKAATNPSRQPLVRPVGDLWLSIMCALGEGDADLAYMMLDNKHVMNEFGDACDNFER